MAAELTIILTAAAASALAFAAVWRWAWRRARPGQETPWGPWVACLAYPAWVGAVCAAGLSHDAANTLLLAIVPGAVLAVCCMVATRSIIPFAGCALGVIAGGVSYFVVGIVGWLATGWGGPGALAILLGVFGVVWHALASGSLVYWQRRERALARDVCGRCGYSLAEIPSRVCPECGTKGGPFPRRRPYGW